MSSPRVDAAGGTAAVGDEKATTPRWKLVLVALLAAAAALGAELGAEAFMRNLAPSHPASPWAASLRANGTRSRTGARGLLMTEHYEDTPPLVAGLSRGELGGLCGPADAALDKVHCIWMPAASGKQCCCNVIGRGGGQSARPSLVCLPNVLVIGAQKSGSTALLGYLSRLTSVVPPLSKEDHFFDRDRSFAAGWVKYLGGKLSPLALAAVEGPAAGLTPLRSLTTSTGDMAKGPLETETLERLAGIPPSLEGWDTSPKLTALLGRTLSLEVTPAYMLGTSTPVKIATMLPHAKALVILRNPVDRAYSEWNMKLRRVQAQFDGENPDHMGPVLGGIVLPCWHHPGANVDYEAVMRQWATNGTVPLVSAHPTRMFQGNQPSLKACLVHNLMKDPRVAALVKSSRTTRSAVVPCLLRGKARKQASLRTFDYQNNRPTGVPMQSVASRTFIQDLTALLPGLPPLVADETRAKMEAHQPRRVEERATGMLRGLVSSLWSALSPPTLPRALGPEGHGGGGWSPPALAQEPASTGAGREELDGGDNEEEGWRHLAPAGNKQPRPTADLVRACLSFPNVGTETVHGVEGLQEEAARITEQCAADGRMKWGEQGCWVNGCTSNIVVDFVARGMYLPQLQRWHQVFGRDSTLVLADTDLSDPARRPETLQKVAAFLGLPPLPVEVVQEWADGEVMEAQFANLYPTFEKTGWCMHSTYEPLPGHIRRALHEAYAPHNKALYAYLGRDFGWEAENLEKLKTA